MFVLSALSLAALNQHKGAQVRYCHSPVGNIGNRTDDHRPCLLVDDADGSVMRDAADYEAIKTREPALVTLAFLFLWPHNLLRPS